MERVQSTLAVEDGLVYFGDRNGKVYAADAETGNQVWEFEGKGSDRFHVSLAVVDGTVYGGSDDGYVYALDAATGDQQWTFEVGDVVRSSPAVTDTTVYVGANDGHLYALDVETGEKQWAFETGGAVRSSPAVVGDTIYVGSNDRHLYALDVETGEKQWAFETDGAVQSSPAVANGVVYVGSDDGYVYAIRENVPDEVQFDYEPIAPDEGEEITFDASTTEGAAAEYTWEFGDGTTETGEVVTHTYEEPGQYDVTLTVQGAGGTSETTETVGVGSLEVEQTRERTTINSPVTAQVMEPTGDGYEYHWQLIEKPEDSEPHVLHGEEYPETEQPSNSETKPHAALRPDVAGDEPYVLLVEAFDDDGDYLGIEVVEIEVEERELDEIVGFEVDGAETVSELVELYAPTYHFHPNEDYFPTRYEAYSENADALALVTDQPEARELTLWELFMDTAEDIGELLEYVDGRLGEWIEDNLLTETLASQPSLLELGQTADEKGDDPMALHLIGDELDYQKYQERYPDTIHANVHATDPDEGRFADGPYLAVTYWAFYLFDPKKEVDGFDDRLKASFSSHASDTETVTILIDEDGPQWIGAAQHYDGEYMEWEKVAGSDGPATIDVYPSEGAHSSFLVNTDKYDSVIPGQPRWTPWSDSLRPLAGYLNDVTASSESWSYDDSGYDLVVLTGEEPWGDFEGEFTSDSGFPRAESGRIPQVREDRFNDVGGWILKRMHPETEVLDPGHFNWTITEPYVTSDPWTFEIKHFRNPGVKPHTFVAKVTMTAKGLSGSEETSVKETRHKLEWFERTTLDVPLPLDDIDIPTIGALDIEVEVLTYSSDIVTDDGVLYEVDILGVPIADPPSISFDPLDGLTTETAGETVNPGETIERSIKLENDGEEAGTVLVTLTAVDRDGIPHLDEDGGHETVTVDPGESEEVTLSWTADEEVPEGEYDLLMEVWDEADLDDRVLLLDEHTEPEAFTVEKPRGTLSVSTIPPDASVIVDQEPLTQKTVERPVGSYEVLAIHDRFGSESESVTVEEGRTTRVEIDLVEDEPWIGDYTNARWIVTRGGLKRAERDWSRGEIDERLYRRVERAYERGEPIYEHRTPGDDQRNERSRGRD